MESRVLAFVFTVNSSRVNFVGSSQSTDATSKTEKPKVHVYLRYLGSTLVYAMELPV